MRLAIESIITNKYARLRPSYIPCRYPIVLCHGFLGFDTLAIAKSMTENERLLMQQPSLHKSPFKIEYWHGIKDALEKSGSKVWTARVPAFGSIQDRAVALDTFIKQKYDKLDPKINLVCHSMGGLDARYLLLKIKTEYKVKSLTTVSTPHHGSECADFFKEVLGEACPISIQQLTTDYMKNFNKQVTDNPEVAYFSYGARMLPKWYKVFTPTYSLMKRRIKKQYKAENIKEELLDPTLKPYDNDGLVSVSSSVWGEYVGTLDDVDHLDLINWTNRLRAAVDKTIFQEDPKFNPIALYLDIAETLQKRGF